MTGYDLVTLGRVNMDLFSRDVGADFADITGFDAMVGGSPTNIAIGTSRLGLSSAALTAVGDDLVGDFVLRYLRDEQVETAYIPRIAGKLTSLALLGVQPPSHFPLSFYREDPADIYVSVDHVDAVPWESVRALQLSGNALSRGPCAGATRRAAETGGRLGLATFLDLDLRPVEWSQPEAFGVAMRSLFPLVDVVIGTEEEFYAALMPDPNAVMGGARVPAADHAELDDRVADILAHGISAVALKRGPGGVSIMLPNHVLEVDGFTVDVVNTVGAGDAFASGLIRSRLAGDDWRTAARFANACGAIVVTRHGCSRAFPTEAEVIAFTDSYGGL